MVDRVSKLRMPSGVWLFLALAFGISWLAYLVRRFGDPTAEIDETLRLVVKFGPSIAGLISATWMAGAAGAWAILRRLVPSWRDAKWIAFALVMPLAVMAVATLLRVLSATEPIVANDWRVPIAATGFFSLLATRFLAGGGLGEELGWRGFMQPQLMGCMSPLRTSLLIGAFHALWHLPAFGPSVLLLAGFTIAMAITATWMYERCAGNLFPIALLHATGNASIAWVERLYPALEAVTAAIGDLCGTLSRCARRAQAIFRFVQRSCTRLVHRRTLARRDSSTLRAPFRRAFPSSVESTDANSR